MNRHGNNNMDNTKSILGNYIDINLNDISTACPQASEIRADMHVKSFNSYRIWGQIVDEKNNPIPYALLKLIKLDHNGKIRCGIAHTVADCQGYYQFDLCDKPNRDDHYRIIVSKSNTGSEYNLPTEMGCCNDNSYDPCERCIPCTPCSTQIECYFEE